MGPKKEAARSPRQRRPRCHTYNPHYGGLGMPNQLSNRVFVKLEAGLKTVAGLILVALVAITAANIVAGLVRMGVFS